MRHFAELTNASVIGTSKTKLNGSVLNNEIVIEGYNLIRVYRSRKGGGVAYFIKHSVAHNYKANMCLNTENKFTEIYLPKSKPIIVGTLYRPPYKSTLLIV